VSGAGGAPDRPVPGDDERGSEVDDYTGQIPRVEADDTDAGIGGDQPSGFGDGDVADVEFEDADATFDALVDGLELDDAEAEPVDVASLIAERDQVREAAMRVQADFENFRKRSATQAAADVDRATGELKKHGLETLDLESQPFDPEVAEAVAHEPGEGGDVLVAEVLRSGYRWKGRTLRPAMVRTKD